MNLHRMLLERKAAGRPVTVGIIGAGKFGTMFLSQARNTDGMHIVGVADLNTDRARSQLKLGCWPAEQYAAASIEDALKHGSTVITDNADSLVTHSAVEVIIEATGDPGAGIAFALVATASGVGPDDAVTVDVRGRALPCTVVKPPFVPSHVR